MKREDRKAAVAAYREREVATGIYVVRCGRAGAAWAGIAADLSTIWNRLSFTLRQGVARPPSLQAAWSEFGAEAFEFSVVERFETDGPEAPSDRMRRASLDRWCTELGAGRL